MAAYELLRKSKSYNVVVLEESNEIGGISRTVKYKGNRMDIGGHRFFSKDERVNKWWEGLMPTQGKPSFDDIKLNRKKNLKEGGPDPEKEDRVMLIRNRVSRIYYLKKFFDYPVSLKSQTFINMGLKKTIKSGFSYVNSTVKKLPETNLENFYINRFGKTLYSMFFEGYTEKLWGRHTREISADWGSQRVKGLSVTAVLKDMLGSVIPSAKKEVETSLIEEYIYPKYGPGQLWETAALEIKKMGGKIIKNQKVDKLVTKKGNIKSVFCGENEYKADIVISSMPVKDLVASIDDDVPENIARIAEGLSYRDFVTVGLLLDHLNLENKTKIKTLGNIVPDCWIYVQDTGVKLGRIQIFNNWSPYMVDDPENKVWIGIEYFCDEGDDFWNITDEECIKFAVDELVKMEVIKFEANVLNSHREKVKKAYPAYFDTYSKMDTLIEYLDTFKNLFCVGRNGQHRYNNMDHSMATSFEAVNNILCRSISKKNIWSVNTEKEYHEKK